MTLLFGNRVCTAALFLALLSANRGVASPPDSQAIVKKGIVVERVNKNAEGQKAGIQAGDILLNWIGATGSGEIHSPFDLPFLGFEQAPRGPVRIEGLRASKKHSWLLREIPWGIATRPNVIDPLLSIYLEAEDLVHSGRLQDAIHAWKAAAARAQDSGVPWLRPWFLSHGGEALFRAKQMEESDELYRDAIDGAAESGPIVRGELFRQWAGQLEFREDFLRAERYYKDELAEWKQLHAELLIARTLNELGGLLLVSGDYGRAESYLLESLAISKRLAPAALQCATSYSNLAILYQDQGELGKAKKYYRLALEMGRRYFPGTYYLSGMLTNVGTLSLWEGNVVEAEEYQREALIISEKLQLPLDIADILDRFSDCRLERGDLTAAEVYQKRALAIRENSDAKLPMAESLGTLGKIARLRGQLDTAEIYYRRALDTTDKATPTAPLQAIFLAGLADVFLARGNLSDAERKYREALAAIDRLAPRSLDHAETLASLATTLGREGRLEDAADVYRQALADLEYQTANLGAIEETRARYRAKHAAYYREFINLLIKGGQEKVALETLDSSRARTLFEMLQLAQVNVREGADAVLLASERELRQSLNAKSQYRIRLLNGKHSEEQLVALDREIRTLREHYLQIEEQIRSNSPGYAALTQSQPLRVPEIQRLLDDETVLLEYSLGDARSFVWLVTNSSLSAHELPKRSELEAVARRVYAQLTYRNTNVPGETEAQRSARWKQADAKYSQVAAELSRRILGPVSRLLEGKRLLVVSDGALQYIPFSALPSPDKPNEPLVIEHEIVNLPSASVLAELRRVKEGRPPYSKEVAVLADPVFNSSDERVTNRAQGGSGQRISSTLLTRSAADLGLTKNGSLYLTRLLSTRQEAEAIMGVTPPAKRLKAIDFSATRKMAVSPVLGQYRVVHFATHGLIDSKHPELSGLVFSLVNSRGKPVDGFLDLQDIYNLHLPVDLVVLSACQTALGEEISGEGLIGLTRGFMYAGASRVVASLWNVSDEATSELMALFYRAMEVQHMPPAAALRQAQIQMWKQDRWRPAYYWAAFQLQGEWK